MKNQKTFYHLILDRSGSMFSCIEQTVDGVNQQIRRIKEVAELFSEQDLITSLTLFNHRVTPVWSRIRANKLRELTFSDYRPEGTTALLDAIGSTVFDIQSRIGPEVDEDRASVVVVIITDGYENASRIYSHEHVSSMIKELESSGKWTFSYIGATLDAVEIAQKFNIKSSNAMQFDLSMSNLIYDKVNNSLASYMKSKQEGKIRSDFLEKDEE